MKFKNLTILVILLFSVMAVNGQNNNKNNSVVGTWKFEAPYAPEGYTSGLIAVGFADQKYSASMSFSGSEYKFPGEKVKVENDTVTFSVYMEGEDIKVSLKVDTSTKMSGKAVYSGGEVPLTLTKAVNTEKK